MGFTHLEIFECYCIRFADESGAFEDSGTDLLHFYHIGPMGFSSHIEMSFLLLGESAGVDDLVTVLIVLGECSGFIIVVVHLNAQVINNQTAVTYLHDPSLGRKKGRNTIGNNIYG